MALYINGQPQPASTAAFLPPLKITGHYLAKAHLGERKQLAAALVNGGAVISQLTKQQAGSDG
jgi:hypothetical protein